MPKEPCERAVAWPRHFRKPILVAVVALWAQHGIWGVPVAVHTIALPNATRMLKTCATLQHVFVHADTGTGIAWGRMLEVLHSVVAIQPQASTIFHNLTPGHVWCGGLI